MNVFEFTLFFLVWIQSHTTIVFLSFFVVVISSFSDLPIYFTKFQGGDIIETAAIFNLVTRNEARGSLGCNYVFRRRISVPAVLLLGGWIGYLFWNCADGIPER